LIIRGLSLIQKMKHLNRAKSSGKNPLSKSLRRNVDFITFAVMNTATRHCHKCGCDYTLNGNPGRGESCPRCSSDLRVCLNCVYYDRTVAYQCRERRAEPVTEKHAGNFCEYFDFIRRVFAGRNVDSREEAARDALKKLLGD
jgi:hypothetical protein